MKNKMIGAAAAVLAVSAALTGCSGSSQGQGDAPKTIKVVYSDSNSAALVSWFTDVTAQFEKSNPNIKVDLEPIKGAVTDYYTKLALMNSNPSTAPDVIYEDSFQLKSDAEAGYLAPLDANLAGWGDWSQYSDSVKRAGQGSDGKTYGVSVGTDARALWYNKEIFAKAGIAVPWQPKTWDDVLNTARTIKSKVPDVTPLNVYSGTANGEGSSTQGFLMLDYGAKNGGLTDTSGKWLTGSTGFVHSLGFVDTVYSEKLGYGPQVTSSTNYSTQVRTQDLPAGKLAIDLDGSYIPQNWGATAATPWPEWKNVMAVAAMPTEAGQAHGQNSVSGGWTLAVGGKTKAQDAAFSFISTALNKDNAKKLAINYSLIPVRHDVATDPGYLASDKNAAFFAGLIPDTHFRPATSQYAQVSSQIQVATEAVMTGQQSPADAAKAYDNAVTGIVGADNTTKGK
ncbi:MAG: putative sugar transporter, substrate binding protein [Microbacteriaceae bacterium]|nr:putative sugar transporter, substrate binding protein [Microbacteriaceae bacterium]